MDKIITAGSDKILLAANGDFLQGFQAVRRESGSEDSNVPDIFGWQLPQRLVGRGAEPFGGAEAGLEGDAHLSAQRFAQQARAFDALVALRIAQLPSPLRHAVEAG